MVLLTVYFFNYGNPINSNGIRVSFSSTKTLEKTLARYADMMKKKKALLKSAKDVKDPNKLEEVQERDEEESDCESSNKSFLDESFSDLAADDSREYCLGATYYLNEIKA